MAGIIALSIATKEIDDKLLVDIPTKEPEIKKTNIKEKNNLFNLEEKVPVEIKTEETIEIKDFDSGHALSMSDMVVEVKVSDGKDSNHIIGGGFNNVISDRKLSGTTDASEVGNGSLTDLLIKTEDDINSVKTSNIKRNN